MTIRRNGLTDITTAGSSVSRVNKMMICVGVLSVSPPLGLAPPKTGMAESEAGAAQAAIAKNKNRKMERSLIISWIGVNRVRWMKKETVLRRSVHRARYTRTERLRS